ncbi:DUF2779 domain-containing protein [bacterium]|nr:DUF2779 domain-containing protein [bacterium]
MGQRVITKTDFMSYLDAPRHLWAIKHGKMSKKEIGAYLGHLYEQGYMVEELAVQYIKEHLIPQYKVANEDILLQLSQTEEPTNDADGRYEARTDLLIKNPTTNKWDMYEVKSSTKVDKKHKYDVTFQSLVFEKHYDLGDIYILHLNKEYFRDGEISLEELFVAENVTEVVEELKDEVKQKRYEAYLMVETENIEDVEKCIRPKKCPCIELCHPNLPEYSIFDINNLTRSERKVRELLEDGVLDIMDVPKDLPLSEKQRLQVDVAQSGETTIMDVEIRESLDELVYPLYFLDYETFNPAIPMYDGYKPYDQMPFQYSVHVLKSPGSELEHYEFVETEAIDPIPKMFDSLESVIGREGSIIVWNKSFEATVNTRVGEIHTRFKEFGESMNSRMYDLMVIFRDPLYADPKFKGSYSIKKVLPVLVPNLSYDGLDIGEGSVAMASWNEMVYGEGKDREKVKKDLLKYCELDTLAMVRIWEGLVKTISQI